MLHEFGRVCEGEGEGKGEGKGEGEGEGEGRREVVDEHCFDQHPLLSLKVIFQVNI